MPDEIFEADTYSKEVTWTLENGSAKDLTDAVLEADARNVSSGAILDLTSVVSDGAAGKCFISASEFTFDVGTYEIQLHVTKDSVSRTFSDRLVVKDSIKTAS